jgi:hypothetical protein
MCKEFAVSPCYFDTTGLDNSARVAGKIDEILKTHLVGEQSRSATLFQLMTYMFASMCYHYEYLIENLPEQHGLNASAIFQAAASHADVRAASVIKYPWNRTEQTPVVTGIPPHVVLQAEMESLKQVLEKNIDDIIKELGDELD